MHTALIVPDGVGVRNFVLGTFLDHAAGAGAVSVWHPFADDTLARLPRRRSTEVTWHRLLAHRDTESTFFLRNTLSYAQMYSMSTRAMQHTLTQPVAGSWPRRCAVHTARLAGRAAASPRRMRFVERRLGAGIRRGQEYAAYRRSLNQMRPDVLFCTHQRPPVVLPLVLAARDLGIPTATFIFSWDNLSSKGRIAAPFDHYLVWSDLMRDELCRFYPDVSRDRVHVVGTPQFDVYADSARLQSRGDFCRFLGADPGRPLITYSGGDATTCPEDPEHVTVLMQLVRAGRIAGRPQVLLRPTPVDNGQRYARVRAEFPELVFLPPRWIEGRPGDWSQTLPSPEDVSFLANLTYHSAINVNVASTMTVDFALRDRPVVNVAFDVATPPPFPRPLWNFYYEFDHYRLVVELGAARFARSPEELSAHVNAYLADPSLDREARRRLVEREVMMPLGDAGRRIADCTRALATPQPANGRRRQ